MENGCGLVDTARIERSSVAYSDSFVATCPLLAALYLLGGGLERFGSVADEDAPPLPVPLSDEDRARVTAAAVFRAQFQIELHRVQIDVRREFMKGIEEQRLRARGVIYKETIEFP